MATEKRLIEANALIVFLKDQREKETGAYSKGRNNGLNVAISAIQNEEICPAVDAVEVVRCKDCEFWNDGWFPECTMGKCKRGKPVLTEPHHYCSYGVRRLDVPVIIKDESFVVKEETKK